MKLSSLTSLGITVPADCDVTRVVADNRDATPGSLFAGVPGEHTHGARFADDSISRGAVAVLTDREGASYVTSDVPLVIVEDVAGLLGAVASLIYGEPANKVRSFAVTGTNGKTTTTFIIDHILSALGHTTGLIGTVALKIAGRDVPAKLTTPQPADFQQLIADLVDAGGEDLIMEVSSHALSQHRTDPVVFDVAGFTNLTQDHLDYHKSLEEYFEAKALLFDDAKSSRAVIWTDDPYGLKLYQRLGDKAVWVGREERPGRGWLVTGHADFSLIGPETFECHTGLPGDFNVANAALALAMVYEAGITDLDEVAQDLTPVVPGRMEVISEQPRVIVDFAHNPDALERALGDLALITRGKLITVTGSAGERDTDKRPIMGRIVAAGSDVFYLTDDDPHGEDPAKIRADIMAGTTGQRADVIEIGDRRQAIHHAIAHAGPQDTVYIAGRGHETVQEVGGVDHELDDRVEARAALATKENQ